MQPDSLRTLVWIDSNNFKCKQEYDDDDDDGVDDDDRDEDVDDDDDGGMITQLPI